MADNPNKKGQDAKFVSQQPHEQSYQKRKAAKKKAAGKTVTNSPKKNKAAKKTAPKSPVKKKAAKKTAKTLTKKVAKENATRSKS